MANRFWVGNGGNWSDNINHWSATTGGSPGASLPTTSDSVFFDANSFSSASQTVTTDTSANCLDMIWTGATNTPTFAGANTLTILGSFTLISGIVYTRTGQIIFAATATGQTITTAGKTLAHNMTFNDAGGGWTLQDSVNLNVSSFDVRLGIVNTNNVTITCGIFNLANSSSSATLNLGSSSINVSSAFIGKAAAVVLNPGTSQINLNGASLSFTGAGLTYYNVTCIGASSTFIGNGTFNTLTLSAGKTCQLTSGTTQTVTNLVSNGTVASKATLKSVTSGSAASISIASGNTIIRNVSLKDITATGGATFYALGATNVSGNTGWTYQMLIKQEKVSGSLMALYHIDSSGTMTKVSG